MASRWIQAKKTKMRRAYLKHKTTRPHPFWTHEYSERAKGISIDEKVHHTINQFRGVEVSARTFHHPGVEANNLLVKQWKLDQALMSSKQFVNMGKRRGMTTYMFFLGQEFQFLRFNSCLMLKSCIYSGREAAMIAYDHDRINWIEELKPSPDPG